MTSLALVDPAEPPVRRIDHDALRRAVGDMLRALGADDGADGLRDTPRRVAEAYAELLTPQPFEATTFPNEGGYDELVIARGIPFHSLCMHHLLPFHGVAHVGYLPGERIIGLSKLARVVELFARDLQIQERLTMQVADWLQSELRPRGVGVAHVHDAARRLQARQPDRHVGAARHGPRRRAHPPGVPDPDHEDAP
jgi:GTP cyclohydrolase I